MSTRSALIALLMVAAGCAGRAAPVTAPGSATDTLLPPTSGYIVMSRQPGGGIVATHLPTLRESVIRRAVTSTEQSFWSAEALSGPDENGRIAYIDDYRPAFAMSLKDERHALKTIKIDGSEDAEIFTRPGSALWALNGEIGKHLALSTIRGQVAFVSRLASVEMSSGMLKVGFLEIWDVDKKTGEKTNVQALDAGLAWFPDSKHLAYVKLMDRGSVPATRPTDQAGKRVFPVPAVYVRDVTTGEEEFLSTGLDPAVCADGSAVLVSDENGAKRRIVLATGQTDAVTWHGAAGVVAYLAPDVVLSWCLPTSGTEVKYTQFGSPLSGPHQMLTLKLARINTNEFQTVVPYIDPRTKVSFGKAEKYQPK